MMLRCRGWFSGWAILACAVAWNGCAALAPSRVAQDAPAQFRLEVPPFSVWTDFLLAGNDPIVDGLRSLRDDLEWTLQLPRSDQEPAIEVFIFDDRATFDRYIREHYPSLPRRRAFFVAHGERRIVYAFRDQQLAEDLRHEASHALLHAAVGPIPLWLDEGLAEYFESPAERRGMHARHLAELQQAIPLGWRPALSRLESLKDVGQMTARDYREAWAWVYFMLHHSPEHRGVLQSYLVSRRNGSSHDPLSARLFQTAARPDVALVGFLAECDASSPASEPAPQVP